MHRGTADARRRADRCRARRHPAHHPPGRTRHAPGGPGRARLRRVGAQPAVGRGLHLRADLGRVRLRRVRASTCTPGGSWAGALAPRCAPTWPSTPWRGHLAPPTRGPRAPPGWCTTPTAACNTFDPLHRTPGRGRRPASVGSQRRLLRQRHRRVAQRALQDRSDPPARALARPWTPSRFATLEWVDWFNTPTHSSVPTATSHRPRTKQPTTVTTALANPADGRTQPPLNPGRFRAGQLHPTTDGLRHPLIVDGPVGGSPPGEASEVSGQALRRPPGCVPVMSRHGSEANLGGVRSSWAPCQWTCAGNACAPCATDGRSTPCVVQRIGQVAEARSARCPEPFGAQPGTCGCTSRPAATTLPKVTFDGTHVGRATG